ncbi:MAG: hypothetical protein A4E44_02281 [Methanosaeta sp. PtaB.Bin018]|jgi:hypothetical protein|nr:hypothetical protein [Methanothrix sp.]OPX74066.1 MAG: hypothetical protein A4E44_02281 [Methanosaeta sp. PtaB.Bin018]
MGQALRFAALLMLLLLLNQPVACQMLDIPPPTPSQGGGGGGGSRQTDLDRILKALQEGKEQKPQKFEQLKKLLYIEPFTTKEYSDKLGLGLDFKGNTTLNRTQDFVVRAYVVNSNPIEIRRAIYLRLEALLPGENAFSQVNSIPQIIQINEYQESNDGLNFTYRAFPELTSFRDLKRVGTVVLRLKATDGQYTWTSKNLTLNVTNSPPVLSDLSIEAPNPTRYNDPITYVANVTDANGDAVNVTLHILDEKGSERSNATQMVTSGQRVQFMASQYGFFNKDDAGKNFTYYYSFGDGINVSVTGIQKGPQLKKSTAIWVGRPKVTPEDQNQYWWQSYNFSLEMKNQEPEDAQVQVSLYLDTKAHPWRAIASQNVVLSGNPKAVYFLVKPFDVLDANQSFRYKFEYSEYDQNQRDHIEQDAQAPLSAKLVRYDTISALSLGNVAAILLLAFVLGLLLERRFYR